MIEFTHTNTRFTVLPQNAQAYRAALDKPAKHRPIATSSKNLARSYPIYTPGMGTDDYIRAFQRQFDGIQRPIQHECANYYKPATLLDPTQPEVIEELDPDYAPAIKARKITPKQAIAQAFDALKAGDIDMAQRILMEALK